MDMLYVAAAFATFIAVGLFVEGMLYWWEARFGHRARRIARRLKQSSAAVHRKAQVAADARGAKIESPVQGADARSTSRHLRNLADRLAALLLQSGVDCPLRRLCVMAALSAGLTLITLLLAGLPIFQSAVAALLAGSSPLLYVVRKRRQRLALIEQQLPEALELLSRALRAGHALPSAIKLAADELPEPLGAEFAMLFNEVNYGVPMNDALKNMAHRIPGSDIGFFVVAVNLQRESGGNLAALLDTIARIVRERLKLLAQVDVYSAEGRLSAWILALLPFGLGAMLYMVNPEFISVLWADATGMKMLVGVAVLMVTGMVWMRSVIRIRV